jgi:hypothetical protein
MQFNYNSELQTPTERLQRDSTRKHTVALYFVALAQVSLPGYYKYIYSGRFCLIRIYTNIQGRN